MSSVLTGEEGGLSLPVFGHLRRGHLCCKQQFSADADAVFRSSRSHLQRLSSILLDATSRKGPST